MIGPGGHDVTIGVENGGLTVNGGPYDSSTNNNSSDGYVGMICSDHSTGVVEHVHNDYVYAQVALDQVSGYRGSSVIASSGGFNSHTHEPHVISSISIDLKK